MCIAFGAPFISPVVFHIKRLLRELRASSRLRIVSECYVLYQSNTVRVSAAKCSVIVGRRKHHVYWTWNHYTGELLDLRVRQTTCTYRAASTSYLPVPVSRYVCTPVVIRAMTAVTVPPRVRSDDKRLQPPSTVVIIMPGYFGTRPIIRARIRAVRIDLPEITAGVPYGTIKRAVGCPRWRPGRLKTKNSTKQLMSIAREVGLDVDEEKPVHLMLSGQ